ncbi:hypothetical protein BC937DRAFT_91647 [Endogone sp. FLAS-F59071]|nr:hypothetical protein BC937DRAFT_91647 [Endogone sp. FLAS-F59071]|eukprot:RUS16060.1 hypothetical protein BC937DRAFT_91647 [Endogone sp. FLAS-F59071]
MAYGRTNKRCVPGAIYISGTLVLSTLAIQALACDTFCSCIPRHKHYHARFPDPLSGPHFTTDPQPTSSKSTPKGWTELAFETPYGPVTSYYFAPSGICPRATGGIVILGGSNGLLHRPSEPYLAVEAVEAGIPVLQAGYTRPNHIQANIPETILGINWLKKHAGVDRIITLGWGCGNQCWGISARECYESRYYC